MSCGWERDGEMAPGGIDGVPGDGALVCLCQKRGRVAAWERKIKAGERGGCLVRDRIRFRFRVFFIVLKPDPVNLTGSTQKKN